MKISTAKIIQDILWFIVFISLIFAYIFDSNIFLIISISAMSLILIVRIKFWKCPYCGKYIGRDDKNYCGNCGEKIK